MNILFMSLGEFQDLSKSSVHIDVVKELGKNNKVFLACKSEGEKTTFSYEYGIHVLRIHTGSIKTNNFIVKGYSTIKLESSFKKAISHYLSNEKFDIVMYTTPPITFVSPIRYVKNRDNAITYLMLKDIFPQNAVDIGIMKKTGVMAPVYWFFRKKEKSLYRISDFIGCMSPANIKYILKNNKEIARDKIELFPNSIYPVDLKRSNTDREQIRNRYSLPQNKKIFIYGGNLGKPQGIPFMIKCMQRVINVDACFVVVGSGTEYDSIAQYLNKSKQKNLYLIKGLPKEEYDDLVGACDVGMIFLDYRFTIPNFPSRILSYMQSHQPILAVTDPSTDVGRIIEQNGFGWWCESDNADRFASKVEEVIASDTEKMGDNGYQFLIHNYDVEKNCSNLLERLSKAVSDE